MKFEISQNEFSKLFGKIDNFVNDKKNQLCTIKANKDSGEVTLATFNGTTAIKMKANTKITNTLTVFENGEVSVSTSLLFKAVRSLPQIFDKESDDFTYYPVTFLQEGTDNSKLRLSVKKSFVDLVIIKEECIPQLPEFKNALEIKIPKSYLFTAINQVAYATGNNTTSYTTLTGIKLDFDKGTLTASGTDSYQLSQLVLENAYQPIDILQTILLSAKELKNIATSFGNVFGDDEMMTIKFEKSDDADNLGEVQLINDSAELTLRQIEGSYPNLNSVVTGTGNATTVVTFEYWNLLDTVKHMSLMSSLDKSNKIVLNIDADKQAITITSSSDLGKMKEPVNVKSIKGDSLEIAVSQSLFFQMLKTYPDAEEITFGFNGNLRPLFVKTTAVNKDEEPEYTTVTDKASSVQLVAPINISNA